MDEEEYKAAYDAFIQAAEAEKFREKLARAICIAMTGSYSMFDNLSNPVLFQMEQSDFHNAADAAIAFFAERAEVAELVDAPDLGSGE